MQKKNLIILIVSISIVVLVVIAIIAVQYIYTNTEVPVETIEVLNCEQSETDPKRYYKQDLVVTEDGDRQVVFDLEWKVLPEDATSKEVRITYTQSPDYSVGEVTEVDGIFSAPITITVPDNRIRVDFQLRLAPTNGTDTPDNNVQVSVDFRATAEDFNIDIDIDNILQSLDDLNSPDIIVDLDNEVVRFFRSSTQITIGTPDLSLEIVETEYADLVEITGNKIKFLEETPGNIFLTLRFTLVLEGGEVTADIQIQILAPVVLEQAPEIIQFNEMRGFKAQQDKFLVGIKNEYKYNFALMDGSLEIIDRVDFTYKFYRIGENNEQTLMFTHNTTPDFDYSNIEYPGDVDFVDHKTFIFQEPLVGQTIKIELSYRFAPAEAIEFVFEVNDAFNLKDSRDIFDLFAENDVLQAGLGYGDDDPDGDGPMLGTYMWMPSDGGKNPGATFNIIKPILLTLDDVIESGYYSEEYKLIINDGYIVPSMFQRLSSATLNGNLFTIEYPMDGPRTVRVGRSSDSGTHLEVPYGEYHPFYSIFNFGIYTTVGTHPLYTEQEWKDIYGDSRTHVVNNLRIITNGGRNVAYTQDELDANPYYDGKTSWEMYAGFESVGAIKFGFTKLMVDNCILERVAMGIDGARKSFALSVKDSIIRNVSGSGVGLGWSPTVAVYDNIEISNCGFSAIYASSGLSGYLITARRSTTQGDRLQEIFPTVFEQDTNGFDGLLTETGYAQIVYRNEIKITNWMIGDASDPHYNLLDGGVYGSAPGGANLINMVKTNIFDVFKTLVPFGGSLNDFWNIFQESTTTQGLNWEGENASLKIQKARVNFNFISDSLLEPSMFRFSYEDSSDYIERTNPDLGLLSFYRIALLGQMMGGNTSVQMPLARLHVALGGDVGKLIAEDPAELAATLNPQNCFLTESVFSMSLDLDALGMNPATAMADYHPGYNINYPAISTPLPLPEFNARMSWILIGANPDPSIGY